MLKKFLYFEIGTIILLFLMLLVTIFVSKELVLITLILSFLSIFLFTAASHTYIKYKREKSQDTSGVFFYAIGSILIFIAHFLSSIIFRNEITLQGENFGWAFIFFGGYALLFLVFLVNIITLIILNILRNRHTQKTNYL